MSNNPPPYEELEHRFHRSLAHIPTRYWAREIHHWLHERLPAEYLSRGATFVGELLKASGVFYQRTEKLATPEDRPKDVLETEFRHWGSKGPRMVNHHKRGGRYS